MGGILSSPSAPTVPKMDIGKDISQYVEGYTEALPGLIQTEGQYRPQFMGLNLGDANTFLQGTGDQMGLFGLTGLSQQQAGQNLATARQQDMDSYLGMAPQFRQFAQTLAPESQAQVDAASNEAARATQAARGLSWEDKRGADQAARESFASRGRLDDNAAVFGEAMNRESVLSGKRAEAAGARGNAFNMAQQFYSAPGMGMLTAAPQSYNAGQQTLGMGLNAIGSATPQMINPDAGVNAGMAQRNAQANAAAAGAQAQAGHSAGMLGALGSIGGAIFSDANLKSDISPTSESTKDGIPVYTYRYHGGKQKYRGVMAQDVQRIRPDAVLEQDGYLAVDYSKL
jgi:hypothetical protein